jgi:hypothetical protein
MKFVFLALLTVFGFSCANRTLIKDSDYSDSYALYRQSEFSAALTKFPTKEKDGFITSVEKSWISLWNKTGDNSLLETQIKSLDRRQYTSISRETEYFFFNESPDGYIPSEHEVVALHLINAMIYMQQQKWNEAEVEARRASYFLQKIFNPDQPHFDDPALRLWLATVWMSLNNWDAAQVDLRRINELSPNPSIKKLLALEKPPAFFRLYMEGSGPTLTWSTSSITPEFSIRVPRSDEFSASPWYERHLKRNTAIRDDVLKSNYMAQYMGIKTGSDVQKAVGYSFGNASRLLGVTLGVAIVGGGLYLAAQSGGATSGEGLSYIFAAGLVVGKYMWDVGDDIIASTRRDAKVYEDAEFEKLRTYRFVRFLPNEFSFETSEENKKDRANVLPLFNPQSSSKVEYILNP